MYMVESTNDRINHQLHTLPLYQDKVDILALYSGKVVMWYHVSTVALCYGNVVALYRANVIALYYGNVVALYQAKVQLHVRRPPTHIRSSGAYSTRGELEKAASWKQAGRKLR